MIDRHQRTIDYVRLAVTDRCNLRCTYCMPEGYGHFLPRESLLTYEELERLLGILNELGVKKIRLTGGEPFVRKGLMEFIERIAGKEWFDEIHLTTNGVLTAPFIPRIVNAGISGINLSLDTLNREKFKQITRRDDFDKVMESLQLLLDHQLKVKINAVVMQGVNTDDLYELAELTREKAVEMRFIEEMPFNGTGLQREANWNYEQILLHLSKRFDLVPLGMEAKGTSMRYRADGFVGTLGIIAAYSRTFCGTCNRLRIGPTGAIKTCLYGSDTSGLFDLLRKQADENSIRAFLLETVGQKPRDGFTAEKEMLSIEHQHRSMVAIGG